MKGRSFCRSAIFLNFGSGSQVVLKSAPHAFLDPGKLYEPGGSHIFSPFDLLPSCGDGRAGILLAFIACQNDHHLTAQVFALKIGFGAIAQEYRFSRLLGGGHF